MKPVRKKIVNEDHPYRGGSPYHYEPSNEGTTYLCVCKSGPVSVFVSPEEENEFISMKNSGLFRVKEKSEGESNFEETGRTFSLEQFKSLLSGNNGLSESKNKKNNKDMKTNKVTISEERLRKIIAENIKKRLNEVGDTFGGQFKLARLEARYKKAADRAERQGDYAKAERLRARAQEIRAKADSEFEDSPSMQRTLQHQSDMVNSWWSDPTDPHYTGGAALMEEVVKKAVISALKEMRKNGKK